MGYTDMKDVCFDGSDLIEETITAFTLLLRDEEKMKVPIFLDLTFNWNYYFKDVERIYRNGWGKTGQIYW